jgi:phage shock protein PspC (stress-responsive transcriptional regulator)
MPEGVGEPAEESDEAGFKDNILRPEPARRGRRLYRLNDRDDSILAGVCAGLAAYTGVDVSIWRIVMIVLTLMTSGMAVIGYLVPMLLIPAARSPEQLAAAYGAPFDAQDVIRRQSTEWHQRRPPMRGHGHDLFRYVLALLVAGILFVFGLSFLDGMFRMFGMPLGLLNPSLIATGMMNPIVLLLALVVLGLVLWSLSASWKRRRSTFWATLLIALHLIAIVVLSSFVFRAF